MFMKPYSAIFPHTEESTMTLKLDKKKGGIPKGQHVFLELYCTDKGCDCRRVIVVVVNDRKETEAFISMGFDKKDSMPGPFLDPLNHQEPYADEMLALFVELLNGNHEYVASLHRHYCEVRTKIDGKKYRGKPFPKPDSFVRYATDSNGTLPLQKANVATTPIKGIRSFIEYYYANRNKQESNPRLLIEDELKQYILRHDTFALEISALLVELFMDSSVKEDRRETALQMLLDILEILRVELERGRLKSREYMEQIQNTLAQKIYVECGDTDLCCAVSHILLQSRVELLPVLHAANSQRMLLDSRSIAAKSKAPPEEMLNGLITDIKKMGKTPYEVMENMLQLLALGDPEMLTELFHGMLLVNDTMVRDTAALMILHPLPNVRLGVSRLLAEESANISPETLRRLIITRNWFPEEIRTNIDRAVNGARRARIDCASLPRNQEITVYASPVDGAFAQSFQVVLPKGAGYLSCVILLKKGKGVADSFVLEFPTKKKLNSFIDTMKQQGASTDSSQEYLDKRICHSLADGTAVNTPPHFFLAYIAEILGKDQWKAMPLDARQELAKIRVELEGTSPDLLSAATREKALKESNYWCDEHHFAQSWFEDDAEVDKITATIFKNNYNQPSEELLAMDTIISDILEKRRETWLERLTLNTLWLKSARKPPLPWHQLFHVAEAVADSTLPLSEILLMESVAYHSMRASQERKNTSAIMI